MSAPTWVAFAEQYLVHRRAMGFALHIEGVQLLSFARFADADTPRGPLTTALVVRWATQPGARPRRFPGRRLDIVRPFAAYCAAFNPATEVPPRGLLGPTRRRPPHHIYTVSQLTALLTAAQRLSPPKGLRPATYATLFGLLAACGLRVSEALRLTRADVDLTTGVVTIRETKFRKHRFVPLHTTTVVALHAYAAHRDYLMPRPVATTFFVSARGLPMHYRAVRSVFRRLRPGLGWDTLCPRPRIHDLRHAFACRRLEQWYEEGVDVAQCVTALATYLGHARVTDTYWYLTATPTLLARAARRFEASAVAAGGAL